MAIAPTDDAEAIRRQMALIRKELRHDVQAVVAEAEQVTDWKRYVRLYPYAALTLALATGYFIVPRRRRSMTKTAEKAADAAVAKMREAVDAPTPPLEAEALKSRGITGFLFGFLSPILLRAAQGYAAQYIESLIIGQHVGDPNAQPRTAGPPPYTGIPVPAAAPPHQGLIPNDLAERLNGDLSMIDHIQDATKGIGSRTEALKEQTLDLAATAREKLAAGGTWVKDFTSKEPAKALGIALGVGVFLGWLIKRR